MSSSLFSTPDFDTYPMHQVAELTVKPLGLEIQWADGMEAITSPLICVSMQQSRIHRIP